jgi:hypothetical protein
MANNAEAFKAWTVASLPVIEKIGENRVELLFGRIPGLGEVVMNARGIDGLDGGLCIGISREENATGVGVNDAGAFQELDTGHAGHTLITDDEGDRFLFGFDLRESIERGLAAGSAHDAILVTVLTAEVLYNGFEYMNVIVYSEQYRACHAQQCTGITVGSGAYILVYERHVQDF